MKLQDIDEMARLATIHPEYNTDQISQASEWLLQGDIVATLENDKFHIIRRNHSYGLVRIDTGTLIGWVIFDAPIDVNGTDMYPLVNIQILPQYRNTSAILILVNAARDLLDKPVYVDDPVFVGGQKLLISLQRHGLANVKTVDKKTGNITPYKAGDLTYADDVALVLEQTTHGLYGSYLPGHPEVKTQITYFGDLCDEILTIPS
jgi:hypothetical protein